MNDWQKWICILEIANYLRLFTVHYILDFQAKLYCTFGCLHISPSNFMNVNFIILSLSITFNNM